MRKLYLFIVFFLSFAGLHAQTVNRTFDHYNDHGTSLARVNGNTYMTSNVYGAYVDSACVYGIDAGGQLLFRKDIVKNSLTAIVKIIPTHDNNLALIGLANGCDVLGPDSRSFFMLINPAFGFTITDRTLALSNDVDYFKDIVQYSDSTFFVITDSLLYHFSPNGSQYTIRNTGFAGLSSININQDGNLVLSTSAPSTSLICVIDTMANLISQQTLTGSALKTKPIPGGYYILNNEIIKKRDELLQPLDSSTTAQSLAAGNKIIDFVLDNDTIYACGHNNSTNSSFILKLDTSLNLIDIDINPAPGVVPRRITHDGKTSLLLNSQSSPASNSISGLYIAPDNAGYSFTKDVGVVSISLDSGYINPYISYYPPGGYYVFQLSNWYYKAKVTVKNYGSSSVESVQINQFVYYSIGCGGGFYNVRNFANLHINPGDSAVLDLGWIHNSSSPTPSPGTPPASAPVNVCFNTSIPDHEHDLNRNNDGLCTNFTLPVIGLKDQRVQLPYLSAFPNPATDVLTVESDAIIEMISVCDITGRVIKQTTATDKMHSAIELNGLETGIYLIQVKTDKGAVTRKIVKE